MAWKDSRFGFMKIEDNKKYRVRVLMPFKCKKCGSSEYYPNWPNVTCKCGAGSVDLVEAECVSGWYHRVPSVLDPQSRQTVRKYRTFLCNLQNSVARGAKRECQAGLCGRLDPMFNRLAPRDQTRKKNGVEVDSHFGVIPQHIITVYNYEESKPSVLKFGNDLRSEFVRIITAKNALAGRDIIVWREKNGMQTTYKAEAQDPSTFLEEVDYSSISFEQVLSFEIVDPAKVLEFITLGKVSGEGEQSELPPAEQQKALGGQFPSSGDIERYKAVRGLIVDVGKRFTGRSFGHLIDTNEWDYFKWLMNTSNSTEIKEGAAWISELCATGNIKVIMAAINTPEPGQSEPEPEPGMKTSYVEQPNSGVPSSTSSVRIENINRLFDSKFHGKPDEDMVAFLASVYGPYKAVTELNISSWNDTKLDTLVDALNKL
jgi:hypothetical protein